MDSVEYAEEGLRQASTTTPPFEIEWGEPPPRLRPPGLGGRSSIYLPVIEVLMRRPGEWARVRMGPNQKTMESTRKRLRDTAKRFGHKVEVAVRRVEGEFGVWVRWLGVEVSQ